MSLSDARKAFDPLLESFGFALAAEYYDHEAFGSCWAEYSRRGLRLRLAWDGKEDLLLVLVADAEGQRRTSEWHDLEHLVRGRVGRVDDARGPDRVAELCDLTKDFLNNRRRPDYASDPSGT